jgi:hypothetical protein
MAAKRPKKRIGIDCLKPLPNLNPFTRHPERILLVVLFVFATLSLRAQSPDDSTFSISPGNVTEATIDTSGRTRLHLTLTPEKGAEFSAFTGRNLNKQVKIVVGGKFQDGLKGRAEGVSCHFSGTGK